MEKKNYTSINAETWDHWAARNNPWSLPVSSEEYRRACEGEWGVYLTPCRTVPKTWFSPFLTDTNRLDGCRILGLASGGGQQMPIFSALGAQCTLLDLSTAQLESDRNVAQREGYAIELVQADMTRPLPFADESFDLIFHPVSNCYIEEVLPVWRECHRVLRKGGVLLAGLDNGMNFLFDDDGTQDPPRVADPLPFNPLKMPQEEFERMARNEEAIQFSHSIEEQLGGQLEAGLVITALYEDRDRDGILQRYTPQYIATRAVKGEIK